jgi:hypothetical protein
MKLPHYVQGTYVGPSTHLQGKTAMLRLLERAQVLAQFDDVRATREPELLVSRPELIWALSLGYGWHEFPAADFTIAPNWCLAVQCSDSMACRRCELRWDVGDPSPPSCKRDPKHVITMSDLWDDHGGGHGNR